MNQSSQLYKQYLEDARNMAKIGKDSLTLQKAGVMAQIAAAIAATGFVMEDVFANGAPEPAENSSNVVTMPVRSVTGKASLERTVPPKKEEPAVDAADVAAMEYMNSDEFAALKTVAGENREKREMRYAYLKKKYGTTKLGQLPKESWPMIAPEKGLMDEFRQFIASWKADIGQWTAKICAEASTSSATEMKDLTVTEYLDALIPSLYHVNYILSFAPEERADLLQVLDLAIDSYIDGTWEDIEKVS